MLPVGDGVVSDGWGWAMIKTFIRNLLIDLENLRETIVNEPLQAIIVAPFVVIVFCFMCFFVAMMIYVFTVGWQ